MKTRDGGGYERCQSEDGSEICELFGRGGIDDTKAITLMI